MSSRKSPKIILAKSPPLRVLFAFLTAIAKPTTNSPAALPTKCGTKIARFDCLAFLYQAILRGSKPAFGASVLPTDLTITPVSSSAKTRFENCPDCLERSSSAFISSLLVRSKNLVTDFSKKFIFVLKFCSKNATKDATTRF